MRNVFKTNKVLAMLSLVKRYHANQFRNNGKIPYWQHCLSVAEIVHNALKNSQELNEADDGYIAIVCSALGHDLFEDTSVSKKEIRKRFGKPVEELITCLTNVEGDASRKTYMEKLKSSPEEVVLIKYADLIENTISAAYSIHDMGTAWTKNFYQPIKNDTKKTLTSIKFVLYPATASKLREQFLFAEERFENNLIKF